MILFSQFLTDFSESIASIVWCTLVFVLGAAVGSFLNVCIGRIATEKSIFWPTSRCPVCLSPIRAYHNLPIFGWLMLRGRCADCGTKISFRYPAIELLTGLAFVGLFYIDVLANWFDLKFIKDAQYDIRAGAIPWQAWLFFLHHAILFSFLLTCAMIDAEHRVIPVSITLTGTVIGVAMSPLLGWPFPNTSDALALVNSYTAAYPQTPWSYMPKEITVPTGSHLWPVWGPLPPVFAENPWLLGLVTSLSGAILGTAMIRTAKFLFEKGLGKEAIGLGDADLMMMAGAFLGWQPVFAAFFIGSLLSLPIGVIMAVTKKESSLPFGPGLAAGVMVTLVGWPTVGKVLQGFLFEPMLVTLAVVVLGGGMFVASMILRALGRGK